MILHSSLSIYLPGESKAEAKVGVGVETPKTAEVGVWMSLSLIGAFEISLTRLSLPVRKKLF